MSDRYEAARRWVRAQPAGGRHAGMLCVVPPRRVSQNERHQLPSRIDAELREGALRVGVDGGGLGIDCAMAADVMPWMNDAHVHLARGQPFLPFGQHGDGSNDLNFPFGGYKLSGNGRDKSLHALDKYTELKSGCAARCRRAARSERARRSPPDPNRRATPGSTRRPYAVSMPGSLCRDEREGGPWRRGHALLAVVVRRDGPNARPCAAWPFFPVSKIL